MELRNTYSIAEKVALKFGDHAVMYQAVVVAEECGEALKEVRRYKGHGRTGSTRGLVASELADIVIATDVLARLMDIDLEEEIEFKLKLIEDRGGL